MIRSRFPLLCAGFACLLASPSLSVGATTLFTFGSIVNESSNTANVVENIDGVDRSLTLTGSTNAAGASGLLTVAGTTGALGVFSFEDSLAPAVGDLSITNGAGTLDTLTFSFDFDGELTSLDFDSVNATASTVELVSLSRSADSFEVVFAPANFAIAGEDELEPGGSTGPGFAAIPFAAGDVFTLQAESRVVFSLPGGPISSFSLASIGVTVVPEPGAGLLGLLAAIRLIGRRRRY